MIIRVAKCDDGTWLGRGEYDGKVRWQAGYTKAEVIKQIRMWFGDWSVFN